MFTFPPTVADKVSQLYTGEFQWGHPQAQGKSREQAGVKSIFSASQCQNRGFGQQVTDGHQSHCNNLWANHPTSSNPREEKESISTASAAQFCFCHAPSLTLCKLEHALSKVRDEPNPSAWIDHPKLPQDFHVQRHWKKYELIPN